MSLTQFDKIAIASELECWAGVLKGKNRPVQSAEVLALVKTLHTDIFTNAPPILPVQVRAKHEKGDRISKGSFTGTFVKMANCDNQIYAHWDDSGHESYNDCPNDTEKAWILIDDEVGAVWVCPVCECDGGYTGVIE
jgi:hypothetical protein